MKDIKLLDQHGRAINPDERNVWVIISDDGKNVLDDPVRRCVWWSYEKAEARRVKKIVEKDFKRIVHVVTLKVAIVTLAKKRYDIEIKPPLTMDNVKRQLTKHLIEKS